MEETTYEERARALTSLFAFNGVLFSHSYAIKFFKATGIFDADALDLDTVLISALERMPNSPQKSAIKNALGAGNFKAYSLADRRRLFAADEQISERTLYRHESKGALELIRFIDLTLDDHETTTIESSQIRLLADEVKELREYIDVMMRMMIDNGLVSSGQAQQKRRKFMRL
jgi:hypothetical protein